MKRITVNGAAFLFVGYACWQAWQSQWWAAGAFALLAAALSYPWRSKP